MEQQPDVFVPHPYEGQRRDLGEVRVNCAVPSDAH